jgi:hypothetical protein
MREAGGGVGELAGLCVLALLIGCHQPDRLATLTPAAQLDEASLDFGQLPVGERREIDAHLRNVSNTWFRAEDVQQLLGNPSFIVDIGPGAVAPGEVRLVKVYFHPLQEGALSDTLRVHTDASQHPPKDLPIKGLGTPTPIQVAPAALEFQNLEISSSRTLSVQMRNPVDIPLTLTLSGTSAPQFTPTATTIPPHGAMTVQVTYLPPVLGPSAAHLDVRSCETCTPTTVTLTGSSVPYAFTFDPSPMPFDDLPVHDQETSHVHATNVTWRPVQITQFAPSDPSFIEMDAPGQLVGPGQGADLHVRFTSRYPGPLMAAMNINYLSDHARTEPLPIAAVSGRPHLSLSPLVLDFGNLPVGAKADLPIRLTNSGTLGDLHYLGLSATGQADQFGAELPNHAGTVVPWSDGAWPHYDVPYIPIGPGADYVDQKVWFAPIQPGDFSATVVIASDDFLHPTRTVLLMGKAYSAGPCTFTVAPSDKIDFGNIPVGSGAVLGFRFQNTGTTLCAVKDIELSDDDHGAFFMPGGYIPGGAVGPNDAFSAQVAFKPKAPGHFEGVLQIVVNDPNQPVFRLPLVGVSQATCLAAAPPFVDFGPIRLDCPVPHHSTYVSNACPGDITVSSVTIGEGTSNQFSFVTPPATPLTLPPGKGFEVDLNYARDVTGQHFSPMYFNSPTEDVPYMVPLLGETDKAGTEVDRFIQGSPGQLDVLFVVSNTTTMGPYQQRMAALIPTWLANTQAAGLDIHVGVTTTGLTPMGPACPGGAEGGEAGRLFPVDGSQPRIVTSQTPAAAQVIQENLAVGTCHDLVQGLETMREALSSPLVDHPDDPLQPEPNAEGNLGFLRDTARLAIIALSDEDDHSGFDPVTYSQFVSSLKGPNQGQLVSFSAIVPLNTACRTSGPPGPRFTSVAEATGGVVEDVCDASYENTLNTVTGQAQALQSAFHLTAVPRNPAAIQVVVAGVPQNGGAYYYAAENNSVIFNAGTVPQPGQEIDISYEASCPPAP